MDRDSATDGTVPPQFRRGLLLLEQAHDYAAQLKRNAWDFAVEIAGLREVGLTNSDLRWFVCKGYVEHALELTEISAGAREFQRGGELAFGAHTCFVLTETGIQFAAALRDDRPVAATFSGNGSAQSNGSGPATAPSNGEASNGEASQDRSSAPHWDRNRHELRVGIALVKVFKLPSPNQETILMAFEEEGWPPRIDDPLPPRRELDQKRRLHDAIKGLNRNQKSSLIRFMGDGTGEGVRWELGSKSRKGAAAQ